MRSSVIVYQRQGYVLCAFYFVASMERTRLKAKHSASDRLLFKQTNKINTLLQRCFICYRYVSTPEMFKKNLTFQWRRSCIYRGISDLTAYTTGANAHIQFISNLFPHMNEAWNRSENIRIHVTFSCLHGRGPYPICATWEEKNRNWVTWTMQCKCGLNLL